MARAYKTPKPRPIAWVRNERGCMICTSHRSSKLNWYPSIKINGKMNKITRLIMKRRHPEMTSDQCVLHSCDDPRCINPAHLRIGTKKDNSNDAIERGRQVRGERAGRAKLTEAQVLEIYNYPLGNADTHRKFAYLGISKSCVQAIKENRSWRHVPR